MEKKRIVAYWDIYEYSSGLLIEKQRAITYKGMPAIGGLIIGIPNKPQVIIRDFQFKGSKDGLPYYNVYV